MKWTVSFSNMQVDVTGEPDPVEAATKAVEFAIVKAAGFIVGPHIKVQCGKDIRRYLSPEILANAGLHNHATKLINAIQKEAKKS